jgi:hypothetical protein
MGRVDDLQDLSGGGLLFEVTALVTLIVNPALGLVLGWITELIRAAIVRRLIAETPKQ